MEAFGFAMMFTVLLALPFSAAIGTTLEKTVPNYAERGLYSFVGGIVCIVVIGVVVGML
jgi:H+/gluconate symporter-like permease